MARTCTICRHNKAEEINQALIQNRPLRDIAGQYGVTRSSLSRHKNHIPAHLAQAAQEQKTAQAGDLLQEMENLQQVTYGLLEKAEKAGNYHAALYGVSQARGNTELLCKMVAYLRQQQLDELSQKRKEEREEVSPLADDPIFIAALQRAIDETEGHYIKAGKLQPPH